MRLTIINQFYPPDISPTAHLCASLAEHRAETGDDVTMITGLGGYLGPITAASTVAKIQVRRVWSTLFGSHSRLTRLVDWATFYFCALIRTALLPSQDVIISLTTPPYIALAAIIHKLLHPRTRIVLWNMDCYPEAIERTGMVRQGGWIGRIMRAVNRMIFRRIDHLVCLDEAMAELLAQYKPRRRELAVSIIANWEKADLFASFDPKPPGGPFTVLYLGNAGYGHEFNTLIAAAGLLRDEPVIFEFVGGGACRDWITEQANLRGLNNIVFRDYVPKEQTPAIMQRAACALITLEDQMAGVMSPSKMHANLAMGLPILYVGPARTNVDEAIERFGCGISLRPGKAAEMAAFIRDLMNHPDRQAKLRLAARAAFEQSYSDKQGLARFDAILQSLRPPTA
jgi:glycosyltransferase involved in cell wall biosynthesis